MKLSFVPGQLYLNKECDGSYVIAMKGVEILRTKSEKKALARFNVIRGELEAEFPARQLSAEDRRAALDKYLLDYKAAQVRASTKPPKKEKVRGTRTFG